MKKLTDRQVHILREIAAGRNRVFFSDAQPPGFAALERAGLVVRDEDGERAHLTDAGKAVAL